MRVSLALADERMARTLYYERLARAIAANARFATDPETADVVFPAEDVALETNWPRYANPASAFIRGRHDKDRFIDYVNRFLALGRPACIVNMNAHLRLPTLMAGHERMVIADVSLTEAERRANARTISMPALPLTVGGGEPCPKDLLASFRGIRSHPCRGALQALHDGKRIVIEIVPRDNHAGRIDATRGRIDAAYAELLARSVFAFVPRGDAPFSYRLLEAMSFGCIPVVLSDGWVLPFDRLIDWEAVALRVPEAAVADIPGLLTGLPAARIAAMQAGVTAAYDASLASFEAIVEALLREVETVLAGLPAPAA